MALILQVLSMNLLRGNVLIRYRAWFLRPAQRRQTPTTTSNPWSANFKVTKASLEMLIIPSLGDEGLWDPSPLRSRALRSGGRSCRAPLSRFASIAQEIVNLCFTMVLDWKINMVFVTTKQCLKWKKCQCEVRIAPKETSQCTLHDVAPHSVWNDTRPEANCS